MEYFGGPDTMDRIHDQMRSNPRIEVNNIKTVEWPLRECFENSDIENMRWNGQELMNGDVIYWLDKKGVIIFKVRIFVERIYPKESRMASINANIQNAIDFQKKEIKASGCSEGACQIGFDKEGFQ